MGTVVRGFTALTIATVAAQLIGFVVLAIVARRVGPHNLGTYQFALTFTQYVLAPTDLGLTFLAIREVAQEPEKTREIIGEVLVLRVATLLACLLILAGLIGAVSPDAHTHIVILIVALGYVGEVAGLIWVLQARQKLIVYAVLLLLGQVVYGVLTPYLVHSGYSGVKAYAWLNQLGLAITGFGATVFVCWRYGMPRLPTRNPRHLVRRYVRGLPIGATALAVSLYLGGDVLLLGYMKGDTAAGLWGAAFRIPHGLFLLATIWTKAFYPHAARLAKLDPALLRLQVQTLSSISVVLALPLAVGAVLVGPDVLRSLFGSRFSAAGAAFTIQMIWIAVTVVVFNFSDVLLAVGQERWVALITAGSVVLNVAFAAAVIPAYGLAGAAWVLLAVQTLTFAAFYARFRRVLGAIGVEWGRIARALVAATAMTAIMLASHEGLSVWPRIAAGAATYLAITLALGAIRTSELRLLRGREPATEAAS